MENKRIQENKMGVMPVGRLLVNMSLPMMASMLVMALYNVVDSMFVSRISENALTALSMAFPIQNLMIAVSVGMGVGLNAVLSRALGAKDEKAVSCAAANGVFILLVCAAAFMLAGATLVRPFFAAQTDIAEIVENGVTYTTIVTVGSLGLFMQILFERLLQSTGKTTLTMASQITGAVINIILDPILIFGLLGMPRMGVAGAALATVISQGVSCAWVLRFLTGKRVSLRLEKQILRLRGGLVKKILSLGTAGFIMQGTNCLVQVACNSTLSLFGGDLYVGVMTVLISVRSVLELPLSGLISGAQPVLGFNYGAKKYDRVRQGIRFMTLFGTVYNVCAWVMVLLFPAFLMGIFSSDPQLIGAGPQAMHTYFFGFFFMSFQFAGQSVFQSLGYARQAIFFSLLRKAIIVVPLTLLLPRMGFGVMGVFLAEPISNVIGGLACFTTMYFTVYRKLDAGKHL